MILRGEVIVGTVELSVGDVIFAQSDRIIMHAGRIGFTGLVAYTGGGPISHLLQTYDDPDETISIRSIVAKVPTFSSQLEAVTANNRSDVGL